MHLPDRLPADAAVKLECHRLPLLRAHLSLDHWAQARKEEMWELAKAEGARGDTQSDTHYVKNVAGWWTDSAMFLAPRRMLCGCVQFASVQHSNHNVTHCLHLRRDLPACFTQRSSTLLLVTF